jgi:hypothetical protein
MNTVIPPQEGIPLAERRYVSQAEVADMVAEELDRVLANNQSNLMLHIDAKLGQVLTGMKAMTQEIVDGAVEASIRAHVEMAFPPGPIHKHRDHHQGLIDSAEQWKKIKTEVLSWGLRGSIGFVLWIVGTALVEYLKREVTK